MKYRLIIWWVIAVIAINTASASVVINQILYNPATSESGGEAIELYNNGNDDADISGWVIATEASQQDAKIPENTILCSGCYYLIADKGWNESKDNESWPDADIEEPLTMYNSDSGIALTVNETIIDAVGWGNPDEITEGLYEGDPADGVSEGSSLLRIYNTNNNKFDFEESAPFFRSSSDIGTGADPASINIEFEIGNTSTNGNPTISIDFVNLSNKKIAPIPGGTAVVAVNAQLTGQSIDNATATSMGETKSLIKTKQVNSTTSIYSAEFSLGYHVPPGNYDIAIEASAGSMKESIEIGFEYLALVAIEISNANIDFGRIITGKGYVEEFKVRNMGNTVVDLGVSGKGFENFGISSIEYSFDSKYYKLSSNTAIRDINLNPGENSEASVKLKINAPEASKTGKYDGKIEIIAVGSEN